MSGEKLNTTPKEEDLREDLRGEINSDLLNLKGKVEKENQPGKDNPQKVLDTEYHNPAGDQVRAQGITGGAENPKDNEENDILIDKNKHEELITERIINDVKISLPSIKNATDKFVEENITTLMYISRIKKFLNEPIKDVAEKKLTENLNFTYDVIKKYNNLEGEEKPDFFPYFCACKGYEKLEEKPKNGCLTIVDFSTTTQGWSDNKAKKVKNDGRINEGKLFMLNMKTNEITLTTKVPQGRGKSQFDENGAGFSNKDKSLKSSLGFTQVAEKIPDSAGKMKSVNPMIFPSNTVGEFVWLEGLEKGYNDNVTTRRMYAHGGTYSEGCTVVPMEHRQVFLNTLIGRNPEAPVKSGGTYKGDSRGVIFTYSSNEKDYLERSKYLA